MKTVKALSCLFLCMVITCGFSSGTVRKLEQLPHYGSKFNNVSQTQPDNKFGSPLAGMHQIGFFQLSMFRGNSKEQATFILWMKERLEQVGHVIILDLANGMDFTGISKGGCAYLGAKTLRVCDFKGGNSTLIDDIQHLQLGVSASIRMTETNKIVSLEPVWTQEMFVDASKEGNLEIGLKDLVEHLVDDLKESNTHYKEKFVFYLYIDTEQYPELKKTLGKYVSPPLTTSK